MNQKHPTLVPYHREFHPARQVLFSVISRVLKQFEPILRQQINHSLEIERYHLTLDNLPKNLQGTRIVHISDMHFHENWEPELMLEALIERLKIIKEEAGDHDVVSVFTGDILSKHTNFSAVMCHIVRFMQGFRDIFGSDARIFACEGNHDLHRSHWSEEKTILEQLGIDYTREGKHKGIHIITTPDYTVDKVGARSVLERSLQREPRDTIMRLVLSHNLEVLTHTDFPESKIPQIIMGGHTHDGHVGLVSDRSFSESDIVRRLMAFVLLGYRSPLIAGVKKVANNIFASVSPGVGENENRPRYNSPRGLPVFTLVK